MKFELTLPRAKTWKDAVSAISTLIERGDMAVNESGLIIRAIDSSHIAMIDFVLPAAIFSEYYVEQETVVGVDFREVGRIMARAKPTDQLKMSYNSEKNTLTLTFIENASRTFNIPLIEAKGSDLKIPKLEDTCSIKLLAEAFKEALKDADVVSEYAEFDTDKEKFAISGSGDRGSVHIELEKNNENIIDLKVEDAMRAVFSLGYLLDMTKAASATDMITLEFKSNSPLKLSYELQDGGKVIYFIAPKVEEEE